MEAESATGVMQISPGRPTRGHRSVWRPKVRKGSRRSALRGRGGGTGLALFQLSCRAVWRPSVRKGSRRSALGGRAVGSGLALLQLSC
eukprot:11495737-Karenia_brevis.AAC.1